MANCNDTLSGGNDEYNLISSANNVIFTEVSRNRSATSLMYKRNRVGPSTLPFVKMTVESGKICFAQANAIHGV